MHGFESAAIKTMDTTTVNNWITRVSFMLWKLSDLTGAVKTFWKVPILYQSSKKELSLYFGGDILPTVRLVTLHSNNTSSSLKHL